MLPIRPLDDQLFEEIVSRARRRIPRLTDEWTDENLHDPGITMIELLAFLKEMQQYSIDRVPGRNYEKFLKLFGSRALPARPAKARVWVQKSPRPFSLMEGTPLSAGAMQFETVREETIVVSEVRRLVTRTKEGISVSAEVADVHEAFGPEPAQGDELFICLDAPLPMHQPMNLSISIASPKGRRRNPVDDQFLPLSEVEYAYSAEGGAWFPLKVLEDGTDGFLHTGVIRFVLEDAMEPCSASPLNGECAIRCKLLRSEFDEIPRLEMVQMNVLEVEQKQTIVCINKILSSGKDIQHYPLRHFLSLYGIVDVLVSTPDGYRRLAPDRQGQRGEYSLMRDESGARIALRPDHPLEEGAEILAIISENGLDSLFLADGNRLPEQRVRLEGEGRILPDLTLMERDADGLFHPYQRVDNFDRSASQDRHFMWEEGTQQLLFGNGRNGRPPSGSLYIVRCSRTLGAQGNAKTGEISAFARHIPGELKDCALSNPTHAYGGADAQTVDEALALFRREIGHPTYAVTLADFEHIAAEAPGLVIRRVCALPGVPPGRTGISGMNAVTVVVEPGGSGERRKLSLAQHENLLRHLNKRRLVTTRVYVISPEYVSIQVHCDVQVRPQHLNPEGMIQRAMEEYFSVEWPFGRSVQYADLYGLLDTLSCVSVVKALTIGAQGRGVQINPAGDVLLPPHGLAVLESCVCRAAAR